MGCYTMQPVASAAPVVGTVIALEITDQGRVALGGSMGPSIAEIQGRLIQHDDTSYVIGVKSIKTIDGSEQVWTGEPVRVKSAYVHSVSERRFSAGRTAVLGALGAAAVAAMVATSLNGLSTGDNAANPGTKDSGNTTNRIPASGHRLPSRFPSSGPHVVPQIIRP